MTHAPTDARPAISSATDDYLLGMRTIAPLLVAAGPVGLLFGALAAQKGLSALEILLMSAFVFAGGSQFVALDMWATPLPWLTIALSTFLVNMRHVLMSMSLGPSTTTFTRTQKLVGFLFLADEVWALSEQKAARVQLSFAYYMGLVVPFYLMWVLSSFVGAFVGAAFTNPEAIGLDFAFTALFVFLVMSFWRGKRTGAVLAASGLAATIVYASVSGPWYIVAGTGAGMITAAICAKVFGLESDRITQEAAR